jgi:hypothetical protein
MTSFSFFHYTEAYNNSPVSVKINLDVKSKVFSNKKNGRASACQAVFLLRCFRSYFVAGAAGAAGVASGAGAGVAAGAGAAVSAGFCSSAFLQPTTAKDNVTKKSRERMIADTFFINTSPPFTDFILTPVRGRIADVEREHTPFFCLVKTIFSLYKALHSKGEAAS